METNEHFPLLEATRAFLAKPKKMLIGAEWRDAASGRQLDVVNPADGTVLAHVPEADEHDVQQAVAPRARAFDAGPWRTAKTTDRERLLLALADPAEANARELAEIESLDNGKPVMVAQPRRRDGRAVLPLHGRLGDEDRRQRDRRGHALHAGQRDLHLYAQGARRRGRRDHSVEFPAADGRVEACAGTGHGLHRGVEARGRYAAQRVATRRADPGGRLPDGVVNIVTGYGHTAGAALSRDPRIDKIAFTGLDADGQDDRPRGARPHDADVARTRRQVAGDRAARRRSRQGRTGRGERDLLQPGRCARPGRARTSMRRCSTT